MLKNWESVRRDLDGQVYNMRNTMNYLAAGPSAQPGAKAAAKQFYQDMEAVHLLCKRKKQAASGGTPAAQASGPAAMTVEQLRTQAGSALVQADDTVRAAAEELSYAQAQFGLSATDAFTAAGPGPSIAASDWLPQLTP